MSQQATTAPPVRLERQRIEGTCPRCGQEALAGYPVYSEGGWFDVVKCQNCLHSVSRVPGPLLGSLQLLVDQM